MLDVGWIVRAHGLSGEVVVALVTNRTERVDPGSVLQAGQLSLEVEHSRARGRGRWIVGFRGITDRVAADALRGTVLTAEPIDDPTALWVHELIGSDVINSAGECCGVVEAVEANPASDLLVLDNGKVIPLHFVVQRSDGSVTVDPPPGLLDS